MTIYYEERHRVELKKLGKRIRRLRKKAGHSQESFAFEVNLHRNYIGGIERGERNVSFLNLQQIALGLKMPLARILEELE